MRDTYNETQLWGRIKGGEGHQRISATTTTTKANFIPYALQINTAHLLKIMGSAASVEFFLAKITIDHVK